MKNVLFGQTFRYFRSDTFAMLHVNKLLQIKVLLGNYYMQYVGKVCNMLRNHWHLKSIQSYDKNKF